MESAHYFDPQYPPSDENLEAAMGRFIIVWGVLECQLDAAICILFGIDATLGLCITANLGSKAKVEMLQSAVSMCAEAFNEDEFNEAHTLLCQIANLAGQFRNSLAHGQPTLWDDKGETAWKWTRVSARQMLDVSTFPMLAERWDHAEREVKETTAKWCHVYQTMWHKLDAMSPDELDALYRHEERPL